MLGEPPLGIMYLSSVLKEMGHEVSMTDQCHPEYSDERFVDSLRRERPDMVGISFLSNMCYPAARNLSRKIKAALPATKIVYGGVFPTINAQRLSLQRNRLTLLRGEKAKASSGTWPKGSMSLAPSPASPSGRRPVKSSKPRNAKGSPTSTPSPFRIAKGLDINYVASLPLDVPAVIWDRPYTSIVSSRGCTFGCTYCNCPTFSGRKCRVRSAENVLKELEEIHGKGYGAFTFVDDNFLLDPNRVTDICNGMVARGHSFQWACEGRAEPKVNGVFERLSKAGCDLVMFGIESGSQRVLNGMNKKTKIVHIEKAVGHARDAGIGIIHGFFIVGSPGETVEDVHQSFAFAEKIGINSFNFNSLTAFRGTPLWQDAVDRGLVDEEKDWDKMFPVHSIHPDTIDSKTLFSLRSKLVNRLVRRKIMKHPRDGGKDPAEIPAEHVSTRRLPAPDIVKKRPLHAAGLSVLFPYGEERISPRNHRFIERNKSPDPAKEVRHGC